MKIINIANQLLILSTNTETIFLSLLSGNVSGPPAPEKIFIGGFSFSYNEDDLRGVFDRFGQIKECE